LIFIESYSKLVHVLSLAIFGENHELIHQPFIRVMQKFYAMQEVSSFPGPI